MRHRVKKRHLNRNTKHRQATLRNLLRNFLIHGQIETSLSKAKETKRLADKLIAQAKEADLAARRNLHKFFGKRDMVNVLVDQVAPVFKKRNSGFSRIVKLGKRRGDNSLVVRLELIKDKLEKKNSKNS